VTVPDDDLHVGDRGMIEERADSTRQNGLATNRLILLGNFPRIGARSAPGGNNQCGSVCFIRQGNLNHASKRSVWGGFVYHGRSHFALARICEMANVCAGYMDA
jgi:hypothetical protein